MVYVSSDYQPLGDEREAQRCPVCEDLLTHASAPCSCFYR